MSAKISRKRFWRWDNWMENPFHDSLAQELDHKLDAQTVRCIVNSIAAFKCRTNALISPF